MTAGHPLVPLLAAALEPLGFKPFTPEHAPPGVELVAAWRRRTWNTNRGVALVRLPPAVDPGTYAGRIKSPVGKALGYFPFFYGLGLQLVILGDAQPAREALERHLDKIDTQTVILQSIHVATDGVHRAAVSARTWGQVITGRFQDAIEQALARYTGGG